MTHKAQMRLIIFLILGAAGVLFVALASSSSYASRGNAASNQGSSEPQVLPSQVATAADVLSVLSSTDNNNASVEVADGLPSESTFPFNSDEVRHVADYDDIKVFVASAREGEEICGIVRDTFLGGEASVATSCTPVDVFSRQGVAVGRSSVLASGEIVRDYVVGFLPDGYDRLSGSEGSIDGEVVIGRNSFMIDLLTSDVDAMGSITFENGTSSLKVELPTRGPGPAETASPETE